MRFARTALGLLLTLAGLMVTVAGGVAAFWLVGPDNTISTPSRPLSSTGLAVITAPDLLDRHGPTLHVTATGNKPLFVGVGQDLDLRDYLAGASHTRVIRFDPPATYGTQDMRGRTAKLTPPGELDWWVAKSAPGSQSIAWPIQDGRYDVVVMNADGTPAVGAQVTFGIQVHRAFGISLLVLGAGIVLLALGLTLTFRRRPVASTRLPVLVPVPSTAAIHPVPTTPTAAVNTATARSSSRTDDTTVLVPITAEDAPVVLTTSQPEPVSGFAPERVSPFAPERVSPFAPTRPTPPRVPAAPMFMSPAAVAKAKSPAFLGATTTPQRHTYSPDEPAHTSRRSYDEPAHDDHPSYDEPAHTSRRSYDEPARNERQSYEPAQRAGSESGKKEGSAETVPLAASPEFEKSDEAVRRTAALLASGALLLTTTSCGLLPAENNLVGTETRPAVTIADAQSVVQRYNRLNNQANQARDAKLAGTIEMDPALAQTRAGYLIGRKLDAAGATKDKPFTFTDPKIGTPEFSAYPMRFVVDSGVSGSPDTRQLGVWERKSAGSPWMLSHSVYPSKAVHIPSLDDLRTPAKADLANLSTQPESIASSLAAYLSNGTKAPQAKQFLPSPGTTKLLDLRAKSKAADTAETYIASIADTFTPSGTPLTFITSSGEALVFLTLTEHYLQRVEPGSNAYWTSGEATAFSNSTVKYTQTLHQDYLHQVALVIPSQSTGGPTRILSIDGQLVGAGGS